MVFVSPADGAVCALEDEVAQVVEPAENLGLAVLPPFISRLPALPRAGGETENIHGNPAALARARQHVGAGCGQDDWPAA